MAYVPGEHPDDLGAHALGTLDLAEAASVDGHLATCRACRQQHNEFAEVKDVLDLVPLHALLDTWRDSGIILLPDTIHLAQADAAG